MSHKPSLPQTRAEADRMRQKAQQYAVEMAEAREAARRPEGFGMNEDAMGLPSGRDIETKRRTVGGKTVTFARRQPDTVWGRLGTLRQGQLEPTLSASLVDAGERLTVLYAEMMGLAGSPDRDPAMPSAPRGGVTFSDLPTRMLTAAERWARLMRGFGVGSRYPALCEGLCQDIMEAEFHPATAPGTVRKSRWRAVVEATTGVSNRNSQGDVVRLACEQLSRILEAEGRRRKEA